MSTSTQVDVAIVGGGPAGSTAGALLKKYRPKLNVLILERERFPRDHVGESQLPAVSHILDEMGCWDKVEAANFPIKVGATYLWGKTKELWDFDFLPTQFIQEESRPGKFVRQRRHLAFQVDRAIYDKILLDHAEEMGCTVRQETRVKTVHRDGDRVTGLELDSGERIEATTYLDASGHAGIIRRSLGVEVETPTSLQNIAIWDYWQNAEWAEEIGVGGTRVQVMSVGYGWIWFIPLGPTRTSVGLIVPAQYYKDSGASPADLYARALAEQPRIAGFMKEAVSENNLQTTKDWSFLSKRHCGENWFLAGESSGFADPILAAGLTITHAAAREFAYTVVEELKGGDPAWLRAQYDRRQTRRVRNHIRFADYWYSANSQFQDLQAFTQQIAKDNGLDFEPQRAWQWLAQGGFIDDDLAAGVAGFDLPLIRELGQHVGTVEKSKAIENCNVFRANLDGAEKVSTARYVSGRVLRAESYERAGKVWPLRERFALWHTFLSESSELEKLEAMLNRRVAQLFAPGEQGGELYQTWFALEALISDGWVTAELDPSKPLLQGLHTLPTIHAHAG